MSAILEQPEAKTAAVPSDNDVLYEVVNGQRVELPPMGVKEAGIASEIHGHLWQYAQIHPLGRPFQEVLFRLDRAAKLDRRPDVAFVTYERWIDRIVPDTEAWEMIPALAVEVVSKSNTALEILDKIYDYFDHGVSFVWVIYPKRQTIYVYENPKRIRVLEPADTLEGGAVLPDFRLLVGKLFEQPSTLP
jgi:Uma2 family endonuclease